MLGRSSQAFLSSSSSSCWLVVVLLLLPILKSRWAVICFPSSTSRPTSRLLTMAAMSASSLFLVTKKLVEQISQRSGAHRKKTLVNKRKIVLEIGFKRNLDIINVKGIKIVKYRRYKKIINIRSGIRIKSFEAFDILKVEQPIYEIVSKS